MDKELLKIKCEAAIACDVPLIINADVVLQLLKELELLEKMLESLGKLSKVVSNGK